MYKKLQKIQFPEPQDININMMPFIFGDHQSLPRYVKQYSPVIDACSNPEDINKIAYLTITESMTNNTTQRRPGIHIERYNSSSWGGPGWGGGKIDKDKHSAGLYMASNIEKSCKIWDGMASHESYVPYVVKNSNSEFMETNTLYWLTDETPHEALPSKGYRQFFRLVTSNVGVWFKFDSTPNPLGVLPNCPISTSKFL